MERRRLLLVSTNRETSPYPVPPLGLCLLASLLADRYDVLVHDSTFTGTTGLIDRIGDFKPHWIGLGIRNIDNMDLMAPSPYVDGIADDYVAPIRARSGAPIIVGGSGFSIFPRALMDRLGADYGIAGEGEGTFPELLAALNEGHDGSRVPGVHTRDGVFRPAAQPPADIRVLPTSSMARWIDMAPYRARGSYSIQTKRGCGHRCVYCTYPAIEGRAFRTRTPRAIADEIEAALRDAAPATIEFVDSTFNDPPGHAEAICRAVAERRLGVRLRTMGINPAAASPELFEAMMEAGFAQIDCTPDTASPQTLMTYRKNFSLDDLERTAQLVRRYGLPTMWFFIFGGPGESEDTIKQSLEFIDRYVDPADMVHMTLGLRVYPDTELATIARAEGVIAPDDDLLAPRFYVSPALGFDRLREIVHAASRQRHHCIPVYESTPPAPMIHEAMALRAAQGLTEPVFRTLLRLRRQYFADGRLT